MPERPKRRKNNKNKRKNKNVNRQDININNNKVHVKEGNDELLQPEVQCNVPENPSPGTSYTTQEDTNIICLDNENIKSESQSNEQATEEILNNNDIKIEETGSTSEIIDYIVESPDHSLRKDSQNKCKLGNTVKSKSLDNDSHPKITEVTDDINIKEEDNVDFKNPNVKILISDADSDIDWEVVDNINDTNFKQNDEVVVGTSSIQTIPLNKAICEPKKILTPDEELSLRQYLGTLNLSSNPERIEVQTEIERTTEVKHRLKKKSVPNDFIFPRSRLLDVIDEEGSSETSRRHSALNVNKDDICDDVFLSKNDAITNNNKRKNNATSNREIVQECHLVGAKMVDPLISEARGDWSVQTVEKLSGAEIVYLTDSSSSASDIYDLEEEVEDDVETDTSVRIITPTIEATDTDYLLKNQFMQSTLVDDSSKLSKQIETNNNANEVVVLSTDNIQTSLYVLDPIKERVINESDNTLMNENKCEKEKDIISPNDIKELKNELNDVFNNLIKEMSDSECNNDNPKHPFSRQDSSSSVCSSQCTAKYNPNHASLNDITNIVHDDMEDSKGDDVHTSSHVKEIFECVTGSTESKTLEDCQYHCPLSLREVCVRRIAKFPFGEKILQELANVSERLENINIVGQRLSSVEYLDSKVPNKMPYYPLPDVSPIEKVTLPSKHYVKSLHGLDPPPTTPRNSSLKKSHDESSWTGIPTKNDPVYVCLSPSQKMLMEKTNTVITKESASQLVDMHKKYVDRRGYNEYPDERVNESKDNLSNSLAIPFKSQTGSRLLALIRDPAVTNNISRKHRSVEQLQSTSSKHINNSSIHNNSKFSKEVPNSNLFKPVPPPRYKKYSSSFYESDESSEFTDSSLKSIKSEQKRFHYSTGNLSRDIEEDISSIQNMHRHHMTIRQKNSNTDCPRRPSLPKDLCDQQMEYILQKEKEIEAEINRLQSIKSNALSADKRPRAPILSVKEIFNENNFDVNNYHISQKRDIALQLPKLNDTKKYFLHSSQEEIMRDKMYTEYVTKMAERQERKEHKVIKITKGNKIAKSLSSLDTLDSKVNNPIEEEFIHKARERWNKLGIRDPETEDEDGKNVYHEPKKITHKIKVIEDSVEKEVQQLPNHLQEFVKFTAKKKKDEGATTSPAVWRPGAPTPPPAPASPAPASHAATTPAPPPPPLPVWTPNSAGTSPIASRRTFRPVHFEDSPSAHRKQTNQSARQENGCVSGSEIESRLRTSQSAPASGLSALGAPSPTSSRYPKAQNPTVTLLQKAREGQLPRGSSYLQESVRLPRDRITPPRSDPVHALRREYASEGEAERSEYERGGIRKMADAQRKVEGIGPITKDGMPVALRSEVKDPSRWYKKMYDTIHKNKYDDDYVTIRYKNNRGQSGLQRSPVNKSQYAYFDPRSGYLSEPEGGLHSTKSSTWSDAYDSDATSGPRRRTASVQEERRIDEEPLSPYLPSNKYSTLASARASHEVYKNQPGRIEDYVPGKSSVVDKEAKQWWDEVMDIFDGQLSSTASLPQASPKEKKDITSAILSKSNMARALKESGYESDSTLVFRKREDTEGPLSPAERRAAYRDLQAGGEPPLRGFRSPAPPRQESPRRYVESDVNIHYRCPVRRDPLPLVPERELAKQQAEHMKRLYREQRRAKYLQELQDMQNRRHQDNFTPAQKTILPLNRYDEAERTMARALYTFTGQTPRELSFKKGEIINVRRQVDANWYEGELQGKLGLFPYNYVEILKGDKPAAPVQKKSTALLEGRARAKFDFTAQTNLELPLKKGEVVVLTRRIDNNWWEGKRGSHTGIFPDSYITVLQEPSPSQTELIVPTTEKPVGSPASHVLMNGSARRSLSAHVYTPQHNSPALANAPPSTQPLPGYTAKPVLATLTPSERGYGPPVGADINNTEPLYVDTNAEAVPFRAMYKYRPQNPDELELKEGDTVYVLEKCDDGWYVGSSQRTGRFGTFPGNYVERI